MMSVRHGLGLCVALAVLAGCGPTAQADSSIDSRVQGLPVHGYATTYYSDGTFTTMVGFRRLTCSGIRSSGGVTSDYFRECDTDCWDMATECFTCTPSGCY